MAEPAPATVNAVTELVERVEVEAHSLNLDAQHAYWRGGVQKPSVTRVLAAQGFIDTTFLTETSGDRGTFVHEATIYIDRDTLDLNSVPAAWIGYLDSYRLWCERCRPQALLREARLHHPILDYCGTVDFFGWLEGDVWPWTIDLKSGAPEKWHKVQTAAYEEAIFAASDARTLLRRRGALYLHEDGREATLVQHKSTRDFGFFQAALACYRFKEAVE